MRFSNFIFIKKSFFSFSIVFFLLISSFTTLPAIAGKSINEESPSLQIVKRYVSNNSEGIKKAIELFEDSEVSFEDVAKSWVYDIPPSEAIICRAPFMKKPESILHYRQIISEESNGLHSYHGYDSLSAGIYDIYTTIGEELNDGAPIEPRSRFRYNADIPPYTSVDQFLKNVKFYNDHDIEFVKHGISAVPHLFSNTAYLAENCLTGLHSVFLQTDPNKVELLIKSIGFADAGKYIDLISKHLRGGFITRFTFSEKEDFDLATYPAPNATTTRLYGKPWVSKFFELVPSSYFYEKLERLDDIDDKEEKSFFFNMQYRNIFVPIVYNNQSSVKTKIFSLYELPTIVEYYNTLREYVKEDMKSLTINQREQAILWLK